MVKTNIKEGKKRNKWGTSSVRRQPAFPRRSLTNYQNKRRRILVFITSAAAGYLKPCKLDALENSDEGNVWVDRGAESNTCGGTSCFVDIAWYFKANKI
jgi:hypothetical protein